VEKPRLAPTSCLVCGSTLEAGQEYCLECGARVRPVRTRPHWGWPAAGAFAIACAGAAVAIAAGRGGSHAPRTIVATQRLVPVPARSTPGKVTPASRARARTGALIAWPGGNRYTIVLSSLPARGGLGQAKAKALAAFHAGLEQVGVLVSSSYSSLHPGYYVIFSGIFDTMEEARSRLPEATPRFPSAYARQIVG
jgi:hypothetical protein